MGGVYLHIPFCASKCPYCDFYSFRGTEEDRASYVASLLDEIHTLRRVKDYVTDFHADSLYLGGGTPSLLSGEQLFDIITAAKEKFHLPQNSEITVECNPSSDLQSILPYLKKAGVNRISLGMQSAEDNERKQLGRKADRKRIEECVTLIKSYGILNFSLDVMLGIPNQTKESLLSTLDFAISLDAPHISCYLLKLEENTWFYKNRHKLALPSEEETSDLYELCASYLKEKGFAHYEISNFAKAGFESKHNNKYWLLEEYLGIGPAAHSYLAGKRFFFPDSAEEFIKGTPPVFDGYGGDEEEFIMLRLRLKQGLNLAELTEKYGNKPAERIKEKLPFLTEQEFVTFQNNTVSLTEKGFLLSNSVIGMLI